MQLYQKLFRHSQSGKSDLMVCIPHAGAGVSAFSGWKSEFAEFVDLVFVQLPGREDRMNANFSESLSDISDEIARALTELKYKRIFLFGHSMGASIAMAVAKSLYHCYALEPILILSAQSPLWVKPQISFEYDSIGKWYEMAGESMPQSMVDKDTFEFFVGPWKQDIYWMEKNIQGRVPSRLPLDIHAIYGSRDGLIGFEQVAQWERFTSQKFSIQQVDGGHLYHVSKNREFFESLKCILGGYPSG